MLRHGSMERDAVNRLRLLDRGQPVPFSAFLQDYVLLIFLRHLA
jgi:hypothetical protein